MNYDQSHLATIATKASTTSVMNPTLMLCLIVCPLSIIGSVSLYQFHQVIPASVVLVVGMAPLAIACWQLIHFTKAEPWRLQREQHNENMLQIKNRIEVRDGDGIKQFPISSPLTGNPQLTDQGDE